VLKNLNEFSILKKKWNKPWKINVADILLFGSAVKGKSNPNDIDLCIVFRDKVDLNIVKEAELILGDKFHVSSLVVDNFFTKIHSLAKTILFEGKSILTNKNLSETLGLNSSLLFSYSLSKEDNSKKVRFVYLLRGRGDDKGLVNKWGGEFISNSAFILPVDKDNEAQEVFNSWKINFKRRRLLLMS
jgi:predicted nucleotidyltransferase